MANVGLARHIAGFVGEFLTLLGGVFQANTWVALLRDDGRRPLGRLCPVALSPRAFFGALDKEDAEVHARPVHSGEDRCSTRWIAFWSSSSACHPMPGVRCHRWRRSTPCSLPTIRRPSTVPVQAALAAGELIGRHDLEFAMDRSPTHGKPGTLDPGTLCSAVGSQWCS